MNTWLKRVCPLSRRGCCFVFRAFFSLYILLPSSFSPILSSLIFRERAHHFKNFAHVILLNSLPLLSFLCSDRHFSRNCLLNLVSHLFLYFILSLIFIFLVEPKEVMSPMRAFPGHQRGKRHPILLTRKWKVVLEREVRKRR